MSYINDIKSFFPAFENSESYTGQILKNEGIKGLQRYLFQPQYYAIATVPTDWNIISKDSKLYGRVGQHALIILPGNRRCEWSQHSVEWGHEPASQIFIRMATGKQIETMWQTHLTIAPTYHQVGNFLKREGYLAYFPWINDCHNYINRILKTAQEPKSELKRL